MASLSAINFENKHSINFPTNGVRYPASEIGRNAIANRDASSVEIPGHPEAHRPQPCDNDLVEQARSGSHLAFVELCQRYSKSVERTIFRIVRNRQDTEDLIQETFLSAYKHLNCFRGTCKFGTWITRIGINQSLMLLRKRKVRPEVLFYQTSSDSNTIDVPEYPDLSPNPEQMCVSKQINEAVLQAVGDLPRGLRDIFVQHYGDEVSLAESAKAFGLTVAATKSRLLRARRTIRKFLKTRKISHADAVF